MKQPFEGVPTPFELMRQTNTVIHAVGGYTLGAVRGTLEVVMHPPPAEEFVETLRQQRPISEVQVAEKAIKAGKRIHQEAVSLVSAGQILSDEEAEEEGLKKLEEAKVLRTIGYSMLKLTLVKAHKAYKKNEIPKEVVEEVFFAAVEDGADPTIKGFIPPETAGEVAAVFEQYDNTITFPSTK